ncbi:MAG: cold shock domain-containing protein [Candidatus Magnetomorum sp.]|nr:cold shock domain-containing protein [Candidatus Magnetomorum sp.]
MKVICLHHADMDIEPVMINFRKSGLGNNQYVCARCARIREIGSGKIKSLHGTYGFIHNGKRDIFFHFNKLHKTFQPVVNTEVLFEVSFLQDRIEAINIKEFNQGKKVVFVGKLMQQNIQTQEVQQ